LVNQESLMSPAKKAPARKKSPMSAAHKAALAQGRDEGRAIRAYLEAAEAHAPKRGRKRTPESIAKRLDVIDAAFPDADALTRLNLIQERLDLRAELARLGESGNLAALEAGFVAAAKGYSDRKGITRAAWRQAGVPAVVLRSAGL
jgi:hypothetical protein